MHATCRRRLSAVAARMPSRRALPSAGPLSLLPPLQRSHVAPVCRPSPWVPCDAASRRLSTAATPASLPPHTDGPFKSVCVDAVWVAAGGDDVVATLAAAVEVWRSDGRLSVWLPVPTHAAGIIPQLAALGFSFHHAEGHTATLLAWLGDGPSRVPPLATHQVGVAGVCVQPHNDTVLVVREKGHAASQWKFPGGLADAGEDFGHTAVREVHEETGVAAEFRSVLCLRHQHGRAFGVSDVYVMCLLHPTSVELVPCRDEIEEAQWMPVDDFFAASTHDMNRTALCLATGRPLPPPPPGGERRSEQQRPAASPGLTEVEMRSVVNPSATFKFYHPPE